MRIFITGTQDRASELMLKIPNTIEVDYFTPEEYFELEQLEQYDVIFDLNLDDEPEKIELYAGLENKPVIVSAVKTQLSELIFLCQEPFTATLFGMNALPGFINRPLMEFTCFDSADKNNLLSICQNLNWEATIVADRVGMITPRIIFMIINEAFYTLQEGTANEADIDESMKLGTNYPFGPFEWTQKVGINEVYETLEAIYEDTHDERYKVCPLLKTRYLKEAISSF